MCVDIALTIMSHQTNDADDEEWSITETPNEPSPSPSPNPGKLATPVAGELPMRVRSEPKQVRRPQQLVLTVRLDSKTTLLEVRRGGKKSAKKTKRGRSQKGKSNAKKKSNLEEPEKDSTDTLQPSAKGTNENGKNTNQKKPKAKRRQSQKVETAAESKCPKITENLPVTATPPQLKAMRKKGCPHIIRIVGDTSSFIDENTLELEDVPKGPKRKKKRKSGGSEVRSTSKQSQTPTKQKKKEKKSKITQASLKENGNGKKEKNVHARSARRCRRWKEQNSTKHVDKDAGYLYYVRCGCFPGCNLFYLYYDEMWDVRCIKFLYHSD